MTTSKISGHFPTTILMCMALIAIPAPARSLGYDSPAPGSPERILAGIRIAQTRLSDVIRMYGPPTQKPGEKQSYFWTNSCVGLLAWGPTRSDHIVEMVDISISDSGCTADDVAKGPIAPNPMYNLSAASCVLGDLQLDGQGNYSSTSGAGGTYGFDPAAGVVSFRGGRLNGRMVRAKIARANTYMLVMREDGSLPSPNEQLGTFTFEHKRRGIENDCWFPSSGLGTRCVKLPLHVSITSPRRMR